MGSMIKNKAIGLAVLAALLYGISAPICKVLLEDIPPTLMAALLYLGAGMGMFMVNLIRHKSQVELQESKVSRSEMPYVIGMILLDILAPVMLLIGLTMTNAGNTSLLNNFEIVATSIIAMFVFDESISKRMWVAILLITLASFILSIELIGSLSISVGSMFIIIATISWGFENNCTRMLSIKDPLQVVVIKGFGSGIGALIIAMFIGDFSIGIAKMLIALAVGFVTYGLSITFYVYAQRDLGAARTSAYYASAPFMGVLVSVIVLDEKISIPFVLALLVMILGSYFAITECHAHHHDHEIMTHDHHHRHDDDHHTHTHDEAIIEHSHLHTHTATSHCHEHQPDIHHRHHHNT